jgi:restriction system protein
MAIPEYQTLMLPLLKIAGDGEIHNIHDATRTLANLFNLTEQERIAPLSSSSQPIFSNRVGWAKTYLKQAGLLIYPERAHFQITSRGQAVLAEGLQNITNSYLKKFPEFRNFRKRTKVESIEEENDTENDLTPDEAIDSAYLKIRNDLSDNLLEFVLNSSSSFFEKLVVDLLVAMGYGGTHYDAARSVGKSGDEGIDGIIDEDRLGLDTIFIQAKRWQPDHSVGRPEIQKFVGALLGKRAKKGVFITTSAFSSDAIEYAKSIDSKVVLIDGNRLTTLMIDFGVGVTTQKTFEIKKIDTDYFDEIQLA